MKHASKVVDTYNPNKAVQVTVTNTPKYEDDVFVSFNRTVTIKILVGQDKEKLAFKDADEIARFVETVDFEESQQEMDFKEE